MTARNVYATKTAAKTAAMTAADVSGKHTTAAALCLCLSAATTTAAQIATQRSGEIMQYRYTALNICLRSGRQ